MTGFVPTAKNTASYDLLPQCKKGCSVYHYCSLYKANVFHLYLDHTRSSVFHFS